VVWWLDSNAVSSGYPGQGGCFYGGEGRCYVSQYRLVFVANTARENSAYQSFSLPFYGIRDWSFDVSLFGASDWQKTSTAPSVAETNEVVPVCCGSRSQELEGSRQSCPRWRAGRGREVHDGVFGEDDVGWAALCRVIVLFANLTVYGHSCMLVEFWL
jgi:hypothetical protein